MKTREELLRDISSRFFVLMPDGQEIPCTENMRLDGYPNLQAFVSAELTKRQPGEEPPSIKAMQELELVDYEPASDKGHFRFYPKGALIFSLLHAWAEEIALNRLNAYQIETPMIYDWDEPDIRGQAETFHERHYIVRPPADDNKTFILRFAGDFGLFRMMRDAQLTYRHLPVRLYEFAPSFRYEQSGELSGLRRLRQFWMPDIHSFCTDLDQGLSEYIELYKRYTDLTNANGVDYAVAFRVVDSFYGEHKEDILEMIRYNNQPVLIEALSDMKHYWVMKHEINTIDVYNGTCQVSTVQLDIKDASLYGINYIDAGGEKKGCTIVHSSIGSPERWIFSILEKALKSRPSMLPLWLAPTQIRLVPVSTEKHLDQCLKMAKFISQHQIRVDIDDRNHPLGWRIRAAEREWIPNTIVVGDKEMDTNQVNIRVRGGVEEQMLIEDLILRIKNLTTGMPFKAIPGQLISSRPVFRGRN